MNLVRDMEPAVEHVCGHCGNGTYEKPEYRRCASRGCTEPICDGCDSLLCEQCEAELHWGCALRVCGRILCERCGVEELNEKGAQESAA